MIRMKLRQLPILVRLAVGVALFGIWVSFEKLVVEPMGLWKYMRGYRIESACVWDLTVAILIAVGLVWTSVRDNRTQPSL